MMTETEKTGLVMPSREIVERIISECFESEEMKEYLISQPDVLSVIDLRDIIAGAMIPLSLKTELMKDVNEAAYFDMKEALDALELKPGQFFIFMAERNTNKDDDKALDYECIGPCTDIEKVKKYIREYYYGLPKEKSPWEHRLDFIGWFSLELYEINDNGELCNLFTYYLIADEICYFEKGLYMDDDGFYCHSDFRYSWRCVDLNISIPFKPGDIVTIDGSPFCKPKHVLLLEVDDDCCGVWALYKEADGSWNTGAVKHGTVYDARSMLSPLYRLEKYDGGLRNDEMFLGEISKAMKGMMEV